MIRVLIRVLPILLFLSCGIPSSNYIGGATIISSTEYIFSFKTNSNSTYFTLYSRYFIGDDNKKSHFTDLSIADTSGDSEKYIEDLGFTIVSFIQDNDGTEETIDEFTVSGTETFNIEYDSTSDLIVSMSSLDNEIYSLKSNHQSVLKKPFTHSIGIYTDTDGIDFLTSFEKDIDTEDEDVSLNTIFIEFVVINSGISGDSGALETVESIPVYITKPLEINL